MLEKHNIMNFYKKALIDSSFLFYKIAINSFEYTFKYSNKTFNYLKKYSIQNLSHENTIIILYYHITSIYENN